MKKFYINGIPNHRGRYRIYNITKEDHSPTAYYLHMNDGGVGHDTKNGQWPLVFKSESGWAVTVTFMFRQFEKDMLSKMTETEQAKYLLVNR